MAQAAILEDSDYPPEPDVSNLVTEDDEPVDNPFSEKQQRLLVGCLDECWTEEMRQGRPFVAFANVGLYFSPDMPPVVPDVQVSLDVTVPADLWEKKFRSYMTWAYGKPPELVVEIVSGNEGGETDKKFTSYANQGIAYYALFDPQAIYSARPLRVYELHARKYVELMDPGWLPDLGLGLQLWDGVFSGYRAIWLRWMDQDGNLLPLPAEMVEQVRAEAEQARTDAAQARTDAEQARTDAEKAKEEARHAGVSAASKALLTILEARFGTVPTEIQDDLSKQPSADRILELTRQALEVDSLEEFSASLQ